MSEKLFYHLTDEAAILLLAFVGGYVDSAGYIKLDGLFTSSITGNLVAASTAVYHNDGAVARACVSIAFALGAAIAVVVILRLKLVNEWSKKSLAMLLFSTEAVVLAIAIPIGLVYNDSITSDGGVFRVPLIVVGSILGCAMGVHNAAAKEYIPNCPATTVMTMTLVSASIGFAQMVVYSAANHMGFLLVPKGKPAPSDYEVQMLHKAEQSIAGFIKVSKPIVVFIVGAIIAAVLTHVCSFWSLMIPIAVSLWFVLDIYLSIAHAHAVQQATAAAARAEEGKGDVEMAAQLVVPGAEGTSEGVVEDQSLYAKAEEEDEQEHAIDIVAEEDEPATETDQAHKQSPEKYHSAPTASPIISAGKKP